jgi:phosphoribosylformylglycinamidine synthase
MLILRGSPALSPFRLAKLLQDLTAGGVPAVALAAEFVHVVDTSRELTTTERRLLDQLLTYGPNRAATRINGVVQVVAPRPGTISPWSSKATDIAHTCGLDAVKRIERVIAYTVDVGVTAPPFPLSPLGAAQLTHVAGEAPRPDDAGGVRRPRNLRPSFPARACPPVEHGALLANGRAALVAANQTSASRSPRTRSTTSSPPSRRSGATRATSS